jgi:hypothetical protein
MYSKHSLDNQHYHEISNNKYYANIVHDIYEIDSKYPTLVSEDVITYW